MEIQNEVVRLEWPRKNSLEEVISALRNNDGIIRSLSCSFNDERWDISQELQDILIAVGNSPSFNVMFFHLFNECLNEENSKRCFNLFLDYVQRSKNPTEYFSYTDDTKPWTLAEAKKAASAIVSLNDPILSLELSGDHLYSNKGTFECVFNQILDRGMVEEFKSTTDESIFDLKHGCIGRSNLATNKTLKCLELHQ